MIASVTLNEEDLKELIRQHVQAKLGSAVVEEVLFLIKSKANYKAQWEPCRVLVVSEVPAGEKTTPRDPETEFQVQVRCG